ncbi:MAG: dihydrodipicolinate synthase family protein [Anaerolineae bacterium]|nr:dihydrodipicolinate synthase family protein [Anaerolineae bacterium]
MDKPTISLRGVFPPIPTPFDAQGEIDCGALTANLERWNAYGLTGYVVVGSNGEAAFLTEEERRRVWETARRAIPTGKLLIAGTGCESTRQTVALTRLAAEAGADAALVVTPHYYANMVSSQALLQHYQAVADASPIPIILYTVPKFTHVDLDAAAIASASMHPKIIGLKDSSGDMIKLADTVGLTGPDFQVLAGSGGFFLAGLAVGAVGCVPALGNVAPQEVVDIQHLFEARRVEEAAELQRRMVPVNTAVTARFGVPGLKAALDMLGYYGGPVRAPMADLGDDDRRILQDILAEGGLFR